MLKTPSPLQSRGSPPMGAWQPPTGFGAGSSPGFRWSFLRSWLMSPPSFHLIPESCTAITTSGPRLEAPRDLDAHPAHAEELVRAPVHGGVGGAEVGARVLPLLAVAAARAPAHLVGQRDAAERQARAVAAVRVGRKRELAAGGDGEQDDGEQGQREQAIHGPSSVADTGRRGPYDWSREWSMERHPRKG